VSGTDDEQFKEPFQPLPPGHCPEPIVEIDMRGVGYKPRWDRALVWEPDGHGGGMFRTKGAYGVCGKGHWRRAQEYGDKIMDDAADLRLPWSVSPLEGKYYGTHILDADGEEVAKFWDHSIASHPSEREKARFGDWTEEAWADYVCDSHWENERDYVRAKAIVDAMNRAFSPPPHTP